MEKGSIKCKDGYEQRLDKGKRTGMDQFGFNSKQKEGRMTLNNHVAATVMKEIKSNKRGQTGSRVAHHVDPFAQEPVHQEPQSGVSPTGEQKINVFKRMGETHLTEKQNKKRAKQDQFLRSFSQLDQ
jgi:hypothetical protein